MNRGEMWISFPGVLDAAINNLASLFSAYRGASIVIGVAASSLAAAQGSSSGDAGASSAVTPSVVYDGAAFANVSGGAHSGSTYTSNLNVQLDIDLAKLVAWPDTIAYLDGLWLQGGLPSNFVGDAQGVSSISAPNTLKLYEAWVQKNFSHNRISVLAGLYDLNSEFYRLQSAGLFLNSSFGIGPEFSQSGVGGPSIFRIPRSASASPSSPLKASSSAQRCSTVYQ